MVDGDLSEWAPPAQTASHVRVALTSERLLLAAQLGGDGRRGVWLGIGARPPKIMGVGYFSRGGSTDEFDCEYARKHVGDGVFVRAERNPPETIAACEALIERHKKFVDTQQRRFYRVFKLDAAGIQELRDGALRPVEGATVQSAANETGARLEVALPLTALPRMTEAPVPSLWLMGKLHDGQDAPTLPPLQEWAATPLPAPVSFEPRGDLRAQAFEIAAKRTLNKPVLSYQPADPNRIESINYPGYFEHETVELKEQELYQRLGSLGEIEVGYVQAFVRSVAIYRAGRLKEVVATKDGEALYDVVVRDEPKGVVERDGELHIVSYSPGGHMEWFGPESPRWWVLAVGPDGSVRRDLVDPTPSVWQWEHQEVFASADFSSFGNRGATRFTGPDPFEIRALQGLELTWSWDAAKKQYVGKQKSIAIPKKRRPR